MHHVGGSSGEIGYIDVGDPGEPSVCLADRPAHHLNTTELLRRREGEDFLEG
jgi:hypothetical protein